MNSWWDGRLEAEMSKRCGIDLKLGSPCGDQDEEEQCFRIIQLDGIPPRWAREEIPCDWTHPSEWYRDLSDRLSVEPLRTDYSTLLDTTFSVLDRDWVDVDRWVRVLEAARWVYYDPYVVRP